MAKSDNRKPARSKVSPARIAVLKTLQKVFSGNSLSAVQPQTIDPLQDKRDRGLANEIANGVLRWRWQLEYIITQLLAKPLKKKDGDIQLILLIALYELVECRTPDYAIINEAVELVRKSGKHWAASLVNAVLRRFTREKEQLLVSINDEQASYSHPQWILSKLAQDWPNDWQRIVQANNQRPALWLRVNQRLSNVLDYQQRLSEQGIIAMDSTLSVDALKLKQGMDVRSLPGFADGVVSVQDCGAQLAAQLLNVEKGQSVLDLCAAPGGKTCHLLEKNPQLKRLVAVEIDESRMQRVRENLERIKLHAELLVADASDYKRWWDGEQFDRILIDAPCSASGVIRRHPDIKSLRRESDIATLVKLQACILVSAWDMLAEGGELLYVTCSVFRDENQNQITSFISSSSDAIEVPIDEPWGVACEYGRQLFPGENDADGFYFCRLKKVKSDGQQI